jgi:hypothetical protein
MQEPDRDQVVRRRIFRHFDNTEGALAEDPNLPQPPKSCTCSETVPPPAAEAAHDDSSRECDWREGADGTGESGLEGLQNIEKEEESSKSKKTEGSGGWKSQTPIEREGAVIERIERTAEDLGMAEETGQNWISMR